MSELVESHRFSDEELASIATFDEAIALATAEFGTVLVAHEEMGNGFEVLDKEGKGTLVGVPLFLIQWTFNDGDMGEFVSVTAAVRNSDGSSRKVIINDGSTGIYEQLKGHTEKTGRTGALLVKRGLRRSDYEYEDEKGKKKPATTFYLDTSA